MDWANVDDQRWLTGKCFADQILVIGHVFEQFLGKENNVHWEFTDLERANDKIGRDAKGYNIQLY